jgi:cbb3-type cytochrome oxidase subunit 3
MTNEFDRSGNDCLTAFFAGTIFLILFFIALVFILGSFSA